MYKLEDCINQTLTKVQCRKSLLILLRILKLYLGTCKVESYCLFKSNIDALITNPLFYYSKQ
jgi:hypothetical protein